MVSGSCVVASVLFLDMVMCISVVGTKASSGATVEVDVSLVINGPEPVDVSVMVDTLGLVFGSVFFGNLVLADVSVDIETSKALDISVAADSSGTAEASELVDISVAVDATVLDTSEADDSSVVLTVGISVILKSGKPVTIGVSLSEDTLVVVDIPVVDDAVVLDKVVLEEVSVLVEASLVRHDSVATIIPVDAKVLAVAFDVSVLIGPVVVLLDIIMVDSAVALVPVISEVTFDSVVLLKAVEAVE